MDYIPQIKIFLEGKTTISRLLSSHFGGVMMSTPSPLFLPLRPFFDMQPTPVRRAYYSLGNYAAALEIANTLRRNMVVLDRSVESSNVINKHKYIHIFILISSTGSGTVLLLMHWLQKLRM